MYTWLALFRGINVGGNNILPMKSLTQIMTTAGYTNVQTYIQSGNVVFNYPGAQVTELRGLLSELIQLHFGFQPEVMVFSASDFNQLLALNPYKDLYSEAKQVHLFFFSETPTSPDLAALQQVKSASEEFCVTPSGLFLFAPDGIGRSKLVAKVDKCLGVSTTARNLNTLIKLSELLQLRLA